ncbi:cell wall hydrolase [Aureimonas sp. LMG 31693]|uniref:cell wall hydrolase n=1 Tax=Aureimonas mangrovi TaxID=2758041 RepID=UPI00163DDA6F
MSMRLARNVLALSCLAILSACASKPTGRGMSQQECMARAMYFESNRSSEEGMIAVGTVVMNRVNSPDFPDTICGVVGQKNQFAPGVLTRDMAKGRDLAMETAQKVMRGARHGDVGRRSMFFHTAGYSFPYNNMHYVAIAGGNAFYEKRRDASVTQEQVRQRQGGAVAAPASRSRVSASAAPSAPARSAPRAVAVPVAASSLAPMSIEDLIRSDGAR